MILLEVSIQEEPLDKELTCLSFQPHNVIIQTTISEKLQK